MEGKFVGPAAAVIASQIETPLQSLYFGAGFKLGEAGRAYHHALALVGHLNHDVELRGKPMLDPSTCWLAVFGDREVCTKMAVYRIDVRVVRMPLGAPSGLTRTSFEVMGDGLPAGLALIALRRVERCYLDLDRQVLPLHAEGGAR